MIRPPVVGHAIVFIASAFHTWDQPDSKKTGMRVNKIVFTPRWNDLVHSSNCSVTPVEREVNTFNIVCIGFVFVVGGNHKGFACIFEASPHER